MVAEGVLCRWQVNEFWQVEWCKDNGLSCPLTVKQKLKTPQQNWIKTDLGVELLRFSFFTKHWCISPIQAFDVLHWLSWLATYFMIVLILPFTPPSQIRRVTQNWLYHLNTVFQITSDSIRYKESLLHNLLENLFKTEYLKSVFRRWRRLNNSKSYPPKNCYTVFLPEVSFFLFKIMADETKTSCKKGDKTHVKMLEYFCQS